MTKETSTLMRVEDWVSGRDSYVFRCIRSNGERWTFVVGREALQGLDPDAFDGTRFSSDTGPRHTAARRRMKCRQPHQQHVLTAQDILDAR